jgi:putative nucleotidyltransferase with HDIG domain
MRNPFFNRGPIRDVRFFFDRPKETRDILRLAGGVQNCSVVGPVKSGKTSLLLHLARPATLAAHGLSPAQHALVYLSFEGLGTLRPEQFFHLMARETARQTKGKMTVIWPQFEARDEISFLQLQGILDQIEVAGERLVYLLDEIELAARNPAFDLNFFSALRNIAARSGVCFVTGTERLLHELEVAGREVGSPFADLFSVVRLRPLDDDKAWESVQDLASSGGVDLKSERDFILELGGGWPYYLQVVAYEVFECKAESEPLSEEQRLYVQARAYEQVETVLSMAWARLEVGKRGAALAALNEGTEGPEVEGLTSRVAGGVRPVNALVSRFLGERAEDQEARPEEYLAGETRAPDRAMMYGVVRALVRAVEARDQYVRGHADGVARLSAAISEQMGLPPEQADEIRMAARVHDIGRVSISDMILLKPGPLTELETEIIRTHPLVGAQILDALQFPWAVKPAVRYHHERLDGSGYPEGLMGDEIPLGARVLAVADVMAAMTADRPYRPAMSEAEALAELTANSGSKYDSAVVGALQRVIERGVA